MDKSRWLSLFSITTIVYNVTIFLFKLYFVNAVWFKISPLFLFIEDFKLKIDINPLLEYNKIERFEK